MNVSKVGSTPLYTKKQIKSEVKMAATSAALSAGLTFALNKGKDLKRAGLVGGFAAGVSLAIGFVQRLINHAKENKALKQETIQVKDELRSHQG